MYKGDIIRIRGTLLGEMVQQAMGEHKIELGMPMQADEYDAFDSDVDDELTAHSIFMANLSSAGPANLTVGPSNASILSEKNVIESTSADMGNINVIPYEQYLTVNDVSVVPSSASSVPNDAYVLHDNDAYV
ncbi:hypothetical protein Tco_1294282, partial [Tanacetum coccineum]